MYNQNIMQETSIFVNNGYEAECLEDKVKRILSNKEPIKDGAPIIYTERKDGVMPSYNIRTDRFEIAVEAMGGLSRAAIARREGMAQAKVVELPKENGGAEPIQGTNNG